MYLFHPETATWTNLTGPIAGSPPAARIHHGFAAADDGAVYAFGGMQPAGRCAACSKEVLGMISLSVKENM
jgi:hypothetical protein